MQRELCFEFGLARRSHGLKEAFPRLDLGSLEDAFELSSQVGISPTDWAVGALRYSA